MLDSLARKERNAIFAARTAGWLTGCLSVIVRGCFPTDTRCSSAKKGAGETASSGLPWDIKHDRSRGNLANGCWTIRTPDRSRCDWATEASTLDFRSILWENVRKREPLSYLCFRWSFDFSHYRQFCHFIQTIDDNLTLESNSSV